MSIFRYGSQAIWTYKGPSHVRELSRFFARPSFQGGKIQYFLENWKKITSDPWTLQQVKGYKLEFNFCKTY